MSDLKTKYQVLIIGGSFAGLAVERHLKGFCVNGATPEVIVVEPKCYFEYAPGALHLLTGSRAYPTIIRPISEIVSCKHLLGTFLGIKRTDSKSKQATKGIALIANYEETNNKTGNLIELQFDVLVICTGRPYSAPIRPSVGVNGANSVDKRKAEIEVFYSKLKIAAQDSDKDSVILVVGGGLVGVELVGEIISRIKPDPSRLVILSRSKLLSSLPRAAGEYATYWLHSCNVNVVENDEIVSSVKQDSHYLVNTKTGQQLKASLIIDCTGGNNSNIRVSSAEYAFETVTNSRGSVVVDEHLRAIKFNDIGVFAAGDVVEHSPGVGLACATATSTYGSISNLPSVRNAHLAESQAEVVAENIKVYLTSLSNSLATPPYKSYPLVPFGSTLAPLLACVSLGPNNGIIVFNNIVLRGFILNNIGAVVKFVIERSKIAEIRGKSWGYVFWLFGHFVSNAIHRLMIRSPSSIEDDTRRYLLEQRSEHSKSA